MISNPPSTSTALIKAESRSDPMHGIGGTGPTPDSP